MFVDGRKDDTAKVETEKADHAGTNLHQNVSFYNMASEASYVVKTTCIVAKSNLTELTQLNF